MLWPLHAYRIIPRSHPLRPLSTGVSCPVAEEKIARVSGAELDLFEQTLSLEIRGSEAERKRAKRYVECVMAQVRAHFPPPHVSSPPQYTPLYPPPEPHPQTIPRPKHRARPYHTPNTPLTTPLTTPLPPSKTPLLPPTQTRISAAALWRGGLELPFQWSRAMPTWSYVHANYRHEFELFVHVTDDTYVPQPTPNPTPTQPRTHP